jgi:hypothetical protein
VGAIHAFFSDDIIIYRIPCSYPETLADIPKSVLITLVNLAGIGGYIAPVMEQNIYAQNCQFDPQVAYYIY